MYKEVVFNGKYIAKTQCRGVQRYTKEILHALDKQVKKGQIKVVIPHMKHICEEFDNIEIVEYGGRITHYFWQFIGLQMYVWLHKAFLVSLSDGIPLYNIGIFAIHDCRYIDDYKKFNRAKQKIRGWYVLNISKHGAKKAKKIVTVSDFSKNEILKNYKWINPDNLIVCYNAWQHLQKIMLDETVFIDYKDIEKGNYYFVLGGREESKNMKWVLKMIQKYPDRLFVLAGPENKYFLSEGVSFANYNNCIQLGYISDERIKTLMKYCRAFLFPSKYEGFGIPPMEALSVGAKVICSNAACLPEIYKHYVSYFDPDDYNIDLDLMENDKKPSPDELLASFSWEKSASKLKTVIQEYCDLQ